MRRLAPCAADQADHDQAEFVSLRERLFKIGARVIEHLARIRVHLPTSCPEHALFRVVALNLMPAVP